MATDRSPKAPRNSLKDAVAAIEKLFAKARRAPVTRESAANAVGYSGLTGSSLTLLASLMGYGLLDRKGQQVVVSERAIAILHPKSEIAKSKALKDAALANSVFRGLAESHIGCDQDVIENELIHQGFSPEAAKKTAFVFISNSEFAALDNSEYSQEQENEEFDDEQKVEGIRSPEDISPQSHSRKALNPSIKVLATYKIPLGANEAELVFTGEILEPEDFDALIDYVEIFKKQFERKKKSPVGHAIEASPPKKSLPVDEGDDEITDEDVIRGFQS